MSLSPLSYNDKNWIAVDTFPASPHYGRVYSAWDVFGAAFQPIRLRYSDDHGSAWGALIEVSAPFGFGGTGAFPLVHPDGDLTIVYYNGAQVSQTSHDGGQTFDPPVTIDAYLGTELAGMRTNGIMPAAAVDPVTGYLYVAWQDARFRSDGLNDIVLGVSTDGGGSWSPVRPINTAGAAGALNHFRPAMAAYGGFVHVTYRTPGRQPTTVALRYIVSSDNGTTFSRERKLGRTGNLAFAAQADSKTFLGDYMGVAASRDAAHAVWCLPSMPHGGAAMHQTTWSATILR